MRQNKPFKYKNSRDFLRVLISRAYLSFGAPLLLFGWLYLESTSDNLNPQLRPELVHIASFLVMILMTLFIIAGYLKSSRILKPAKMPEPLVEKLLLYRKALTLKFVYFSVAAFIVSIGLYLTANELMSVLFAGVIVVFSISNPTLQGIVKDLHLKDEERDMILKVKDFK